MSLIHPSCCARCPSNLNRLAGRVDPESADMLDWPRASIAHEALFPCAWRTEKVCRGIVDFYGLVEEELKAVGWHACPDCGRAILERCLDCNPIRGIPFFSDVP